MQQPEDQKTLNSLRLGWLTVEVYGRIRRLRSYKDITRDDKRRFDFSNRELPRVEELFLAIEFLKQTHTQIGYDLPEIPASLVTRGDDLKSWKKKLDLGELHRDFEIWSKAVWAILSVEDGELGQAFTFGGSLADTYWHSDLDASLHLVRPGRLFGISKRAAWLAESLPSYLGDILKYSLRYWAKTNQNASEKVSLPYNQKKVWSDLIYGFRSPESYLPRKDQRKILWLNWLISFVVVSILLVLIWIAVVLLIANSDEFLEWFTSFAGGQGVIVDELSKFVANIQNWSSVLAALSSTVVFLIGFIKSFSGWTISLHKSVGDTLRRWWILKNTTRELKKAEDKAEKETKAKEGK